MQDSRDDFDVGDDFSSRDESMERLFFDYVAEFAAGAAHELNNPLAIISGTAQKFLKTETDPKKREALATIISQAKRGHEMIAEIRSFARPPRPEFASVDVVRLFDDWTNRELRRAGARSFRAEIQAPSRESFELKTDPALLACALDSLGKNALENASKAGRLYFYLNLPESDADGSRSNDSVSSVLELGVENDGSNLTEEEVALCFAPFYSGRQAGRGLGFGLPKAKRFAEILGARVTSEPARVFPTGRRWGVAFHLEAFN